MLRRGLRGVGAAFLLPAVLLISSAEANEDYLPAMSLVPDTAAGVVRIPDVPKLCDAWKGTTLSALTNDPAMEPFAEVQRARAEQRGGMLGFNLGINPQDVLEIASGEALLAWLPFQDPRRPFALALVVDIRGKRAAADAVLAQVDADLKTAGATVSETSHGDDKIRVYRLKPTPGEIKIDQIAVSINDQRVIAADRATVVTGLLDAVAGQDERPRLEQAEDFLGVRGRSARAAGEPSGDPAGDTEAQDGEADDELGRVEWFARPLAMGRIIKEAARIDRGQRVDILNLLQRQGFDAVRAAGGTVMVGHPDYDLLHHGFIWAPGEFRLAARMLQFPNDAAHEVPSWVGEGIASLTRLNWKMADAFWHAEPIVNDAFGEEIFRDILDGIRDDQDGPRIDIAENVVPNLGDHLMILTDNVMPADLRSERVLVAIEVRNAAALRQAVKQAMDVEPDATVIPSGIEGVTVYRVLRSDDPADFEAELFEDLGLGRDVDADAPPPLLNQWAITVIDGGGAGGGNAQGEQAQGSAAGQPGYLMFSSHPELLLETLGELAAPAGNGFGNVQDVQEVKKHIKRLGGEQHAFSRMARSNLTLRAKYSLVRQGKLRDSDSILATLFRRVFNADDETREDLGTDKLPPFQQIEQFFRPAGGFAQETESGWTLDGFLLR